MVNTKLDTKIPQFSAASDVECFLRPSAVQLEAKASRCRFAAPFFPTNSNKQGCDEPPPPPPCSMCLSACTCFTSDTNGCKHQPVHQKCTPPHLPLHVRL